MPARFRVIRSGFSALLLVFAVAVTGTAEPSTPPGRLTVVVLWFEDKTGDSELSHWRCAVPRNSGAIT